MIRDNENVARMLIDVAVLINISVIKKEAKEILKP
jgi:hypothetical protein